MQDGKQKELLQLVEQHRMQKRNQAKRGATEKLSIGESQRRDERNLDTEGPVIDTQLDLNPPSSPSQHENEEQPARLATDGPRQVNPHGSDPP